MERNDESLSTRDLASPGESTTGAVSTELPDGRRPQAESSGQPPVQADQTQDSAVESSLDTPEGDSQFDTQPAAPDQHFVSRQPATEADTAISSQSSSAGTTAPPPQVDSGNSSNEPLLASDVGATFQRRWEEVQTRFVDEPRGAVEDADGLVASLMQQLADGFARERERLEAQWGRGEDISTEDLRVALQRYRSFFQRLLST